MVRDSWVKVLPPTTNMDTNLNKQKATTEAQAQAADFSEKTTLVNNSASGNAIVKLPDEVIESKDNDGYLGRIKKFAGDHPYGAVGGAVVLGIGVIAAGAYVGSWIYNQIAGNDEENNITASPNNNSTSNPITYYLTSVNDKIWSAVSEKLTSLTTTTTPPTSTSSDGSLLGRLVQPSTTTPMSDCLTDSKINAYLHSKGCAPKGITLKACKQLYEKIWGGDECFGELYNSSNNQLFLDKIQECGGSLAGMCNDYQG